MSKGTKKVKGAKNGSPAAASTPVQPPRQPLTTAASPAQASVPAAAKPPVIPPARPQQTPPVASAPSSAPSPVPSAPAKTTTTLPSSSTAKFNHVVLEYVRPEAKNVCVAGSFNGWKPDLQLKPAGNGRWIGDVDVQPGRHEYLFVVDGQWVPDPNAKETVSNPFGGRNSVLVVN